MTEKPLTSRDQQMDRTATLADILRSRLWKLIFAGLLALFLTSSIYYLSSSSIPWPYADSINNARPASPYHPKANTTSTHVDEIKRWWKPWATAIKSAKPGISKVKTRDKAGLHGPKDGHKPRVLPANLLDVSDDDIEKLRTAHAQYRSFIDTYGNYERDADQLFHNRGVVLVAGGKFFGPAILTILMLRESGSTLPVELFVPHWSDYEHAICEDYLPKLNIRCLVLEDFFSDYGSRPFRTAFRFQLKSFALLFSSFRDVLLLDSDSMPNIDPAQLFDSDAFNFTGMITWPDFWQASESPYFYKITGLDFPGDLSATGAESGQLVIDKSRHLKTLMLVMYYNIYGPGLYYTILAQGAAGEGDRTTFEAAATVLGASYHRVRTILQTVGRFIGLKPGTEFRGSAMVQMAPIAGAKKDDPNFGLLVGSASKQVAFLHANAPKLDAGPLVDGLDLKNQAGEHIRLFGDVKSQQGLFGQDIEKKIWVNLKKSGCDLAEVLKEWRKRKNLCKKLEEHYDAVFGT